MQEIITKEMNASGWQFKQPWKAALMFTVVGVLLTVPAINYFSAKGILDSDSVGPDLQFAHLATLPGYILKEDLGICPSTYQAGDLEIKASACDLEAISLLNVLSYFLAGLAIGWFRRGRARV